ncbi:hypothetical protein V8G54_023987 [Vigna mungo]|uniref:Retrovirus-related Pol polyprotein from transposon TNT 1-94-like beta-barrel domain-containing protein n=1 Tax=Vigna mungo TaxID=3915 RepID=A0AAQ3RT23_VIGMU
MTTRCKVLDVACHEGSEDLGVNIGLDEGVVDLGDEYTVEGVFSSSSQISRHLSRPQRYRLVLHKSLLQLQSLPMTDPAEEAAYIEELYEYMEQLKNALKIFTKLEIIQNHYLKFQFHNTHKGDMKMEQYLVKMKNLIDKLKLAGSPISNSNLVIQTLNGLDSDYNPMVVKLSNEIDINCVELQTQLGNKFGSQGDWRDSTFKGTRGGRGKGWMLKPINQELDEVNGTNSLLVGNGEKLKVMASGTTKLNNLHLHDVLYVPKITKNLLSIAKFTIDNNILVEFNENCCFVKDKLTRKALLKGELKDDLYELCNDKDSYVYMSLKENWHKLLGHPNNKVLEKGILTAFTHQHEAFQCALSLLAHLTMKFLWSLDPSHSGVCSILPCVPSTRSLPGAAPYLCPLHFVPFAPAITPQPHQCPGVTMKSLMLLLLLSPVQKKRNAKGCNGCPISLEAFQRFGCFPPLKENHYRRRKRRNLKVGGVSECIHILGEGKEEEFDFLGSGGVWDAFMNEEVQRALCGGGGSNALLLTLGRPPTYPQEHPLLTPKIDDHCSEENKPDGQIPNGNIGKDRTDKVSGLYESRSSTSLAPGVLPPEVSPTTIIWSYDRRPPAIPTHERRNHGISGSGRQQSLTIEEETEYQRDLLSDRTKFNNGSKAGLVNENRMVREGTEQKVNENSKMKVKGLNPGKRPDDKTGRQCKTGRQYKTVCQYKTGRLAPGVFNLKGARDVWSFREKEEEKWVSERLSSEEEERLHAERWQGLKSYLKYDLQSGRPSIRNLPHGFYYQEIFIPLQPDASQVPVSHYHPRKLEGHQPQTMASFARGAASLTRVGLSSSKSPIQLIHRRGLAGAADFWAVPFAFACSSAAFFENLGLGCDVKNTVCVCSAIFDHHGPPKVNFWKDPMSPSKWKEEHFVIISLAGWGLLVYGGYKLFTGGKGKKEEVLSCLFVTA